MEALNLEDAFEQEGLTNLTVGIKSEYYSENLGDFWLSATDLGCPSDYHWCSLNRDFVHPEIRWKDGHPKAGPNCVYLEVRNESMLLATADCNEEKMFLCDVRKNATFRRGMQGECADIWNITIDQIDLLLNASAFLSENISLNLKFDLGALVKIATLRQIELVSQDEPVKMQQGFDAYDICSKITSDDECVTAYETYKCGQQNQPDLTSKIVVNHFDNGTVIQNVVTAYKRCCARGMRLFEPRTVADINWAYSLNPQAPLPSAPRNMFVGETEFINRTHEVWCRSRVVVPDSIYRTTAKRYLCDKSFVYVYTAKVGVWYRTGDPDVFTYFISLMNTTNFTSFDYYVCEKP
ncbi:Hypothetical predicted protein [Cloeon dipterum]|uniref:C-type lectin domain-containing protein n=1 Tax=Cloeon dipterum TaxID=197152 RepID=A0A8S1E7X0_9INSE|nr:Hypothetical predicted protein [Cloeon dipterum]